MVCGSKAHMYLVTLKEPFSLESFHVKCSNLVDISAQTNQD